MFLARTVLEEQWNEQAQALMELGEAVECTRHVGRGTPQPDETGTSARRRRLPQLDLARAVGSIQQIQRARHPFAVGH